MIYNFRIKQNLRVKDIYHNCATSNEILLPSDPVQRPKCEIALFGRCPLSYTNLPLQA